MSKGTPSMGKRSKGKSHIVCRRCGRHAYSIARGRCAHCGYGASAKRRRPSWSKGR